MISAYILTVIIVTIFATVKEIQCNEDAKRLYDDLMVNYNRHRRPANSPSEPVHINIRLRLSQIIDVHELDQMMTCSVWLKQSWVDNKLSWNPESYGGVRVLYVPYEMVWVPDIVLFNNADSNYNITINTKATLYYTGNVTWEPPAIFKSLCQMDVRWFPFDEQSCDLKFGSWTYPENLLTLELDNIQESNSWTEEYPNEQGEMDNVTVVEEGIDFSDYYPSVEWDIMSRIAKRRVRKFPPGPKTGRYVELHYFIVLRRRPLFYTVNLVMPCMLISFMTVLVFYLPSESGEKLSYSINILVALTMFFLLLIEIVPANSITLPFVGKYLFFTTILVSFSVYVTVVVLQLHFRKPTTHTMSNWIKKVFLNFLPRVLLMRRPRGPFNQPSLLKEERILFNYHEHRVNSNDGFVGRYNKTVPPMNEKMHRIYNSPSVQKSFQNLVFISELLKKKERDIRVDEDWKYVAMVVDRLFLIVFSVVCFVGTGWILLQAPTFYDHRQPIDLQYRPTE